MVLPRGVLRISSDRDDQRIFWGRKILASIFFGKLDLSRDFFGYSKLMFLFFMLYHLMLSGNF